MSGLAEEAGFDRARIDRDYNARATVSVEAFEAEIARYQQATAEARRDYARHLDVIYDEMSGQGLDIYGPPLGEAAEPLATFVYFHGGYWRALSKAESAMMAGMLAREGFATVVVDYRLAPEVDLAEILREIRASLAFLWHRGREFGLDPDRIAVGGSSAGGHLTGAALASGWRQTLGLPEDLIKFAYPISGLFDLSPISMSFAQDWLQLDGQSVEALSPIRHLPRHRCPISVVWAEADPPGFHRQSLAFAEAWQKDGGICDLLEIPNRNHFDLLMDFSCADTALSQTLLEGMRGLGD